MDDAKKWYTSKGVWSGAITVLLAAYGAFAGDLAPQLHINAPHIPEWVFTILGAMGVYSRLTATKTIE